MESTLLLDDPDHVPATLSDAAADELIARLTAEPETLRELFPHVSQTPAKLLRTKPAKRPLVLIPKAEAWADS